MFKFSREVEYIHICVEYNFKKLMYNLESIVNIAINQKEFC